MRSFRTVLLVSCGVMLLTLVALIPGFASASTQGSIAQGFRTSGTNLPVGALVATLQDAPDTVELATLQHAERLVGVLSDKPLIFVSDSTSKAEVVTNGITSALVSDVNGEVKTGDRIAISSISGVGAKTASGVMVGVAQADFDRTSAVERTVTDANGKDQKVHIGLVPVRVAVGMYGDSQTTQAFSFLQDAASAIAGKPVSVVRAILAALLLLLLFTVITVLLYGAVRSSVISIGRNPLSEAALRKSLLQAGLIAGGITVAGLASTYLILIL